MGSSVPSTESSNILVRLILLLHVLLGVLTIRYFDGTGDDGDSIMHYLIAKYAPQHPELYFGHWGKPLFTLLASPFAQLGMQGMKFFNLVVTVLASWLTFKAAKQYKIVNASWIPLFFLVTPLVYALTFSGLTEPLFALLLAGSIYAVSRKQYIAFAIIISFLPFCRSEGLLLVGVAGLYLLIQRKAKYVPWLLTGHVVYGVAGWISRGSPLWVITDIPYAGISDWYGSGHFWHYFNQLPYLLGWPIAILLALGAVYYLWAVFQRRWNISREEWWLVTVGFTVFFFFHTLSWYYGVFNSFGLKRVFIAVMPLVAIFTLRGWNGLLVIAGQVAPPVAQVIKFASIGLLLIWPLTENHTALHFDKDLVKTRPQRRMDELAQQIDVTGTLCSFNHPYLYDALGIDPFDPTQFKPLGRDHETLLPQGTVVIWDSWFSQKEEDLQPEDFAAENYDRLGVYSVRDKNAEWQMHLLVRK